MQELKLPAEICICQNCKYYGCERSKNCDTICDKWTISEFILEDYLQDSADMQE